MTKAEKQIRNRKAVALAAFLAGAGVSIAANVIAAEPTWLARAVAVWPALALLLTVHLYQHVPVTKAGWLGFVHKISVLAVIGIAAWVSYWHIHEVVLRAGESLTTAYLFPATVDAMMAVASAVYAAKPAPARKPAARKAPARKAQAPATVTRIHAG